MNQNQNNGANRTGGNKYNQNNSHGVSGGHSANRQNGYDVPHSRPYTGTPNGIPYGQADTRRQMGQKTFGNGQRRSNGQGRGYPQNAAAKTEYYYENVRSSHWIPLFASLLLLMVTAGIFFTVVNSRKIMTADVGANQTIPIETSAKHNDGEENQQVVNTNKIRVEYAMLTKDTLTLTNEIASDYAIMIDVANNTIVAQKQPDVMIYPASMTKIMTLIVAYENCKNLDDTFTMTSDITDPLYVEGASVAGFSIGEEVTIRDLLYGAVLPSGADATDALAIYTAGSIEGFVEIMNKKVVQMGLSNTHFVNPSGLHDSNHYSTPHEMALILEYALQIEDCRKVLSTYQYTTESTPQHPDGILLTSTMFSRMEGGESGVAEVIAGKTGYTNEGLHCLASMAQTEDGMEYILVTAHAPATYDPVYDCINLYKLLFSKSDDAAG